MQFTQAEEAFGIIPAMKKPLMSLAVVAALPLLAQTGTEIETNLTVVVTATPITHEESVEKDGAEVVTIGREQLAALNRTNINVQNMTVKAAKARKKDLVYMAAYLDPHTSGAVFGRYKKSLRRFV